MPDSGMILTTSGYLGISASAMPPPSLANPSDVIRHYAKMEVGLTSLIGQRGNPGHDAMVAYFCPGWILTKAGHVVYKNNEYGNSAAVLPALSYDRCQFAM